MTNISHIFEQFEAATAEQDGHTAMEILKNGLDISAEKAAEILICYERNRRLGEIRIANLYIERAG